MLAHLEEKQNHTHDRPLITTSSLVINAKALVSDTSYHLGPGWHLHCKHTQASAAAAVPALLVVHVDRYLLVGLQAQKGRSEIK